MNAVKVLLAIDESPASVEAANEVARRSWPADSTVRVFHTVGKFVPPAQELWYDAGGSLEQAREEIKNRSKDLVENVAKHLIERGLTAETKVKDGEAGRAILEEAADWEADLIVIGSRGAAVFERLLTGSVSHYVVDHATCPVEVIHAKQKGESD